MDGDPIPNADHVTRVCGRGQDNREILSTGFALTLEDKKVGNKLSGDWVECAYTPPRNRNIQGSLRRLRRRIVPCGQLVAVLKAEQVRQIRRNGCQLDIAENHHRQWRCHCAIIGMTDGVIDLDLQQDLADLANSGVIETLL